MVKNQLKYFKKAKKINSQHGKISLLISNVEIIAMKVADNALSQFELIIQYPFFTKWALLYLHGMFVIVFSCGLQQLHASYSIQSWVGASVTLLTFLAEGKDRGSGAGIEDSPLKSG